MRQNAVGRWRVGRGIHFPLGPWLNLECTRVLNETLLVPVLMYGNETMLWKEKKRSRVWDVQMDNRRRLLGIRRMNRVPNAWIREL